MHTFKFEIKHRTSVVFRTLADGCGSLVLEDLKTDLRYT
jgi:hypothetical protein